MMRLMPVNQLATVLGLFHGCTPVPTNGCEAYELVQAGKLRQFWAWVGETQSGDWVCKGESLLVMIAAGLNAHKAIAVLLDRGADPNTRASDGSTALHNAAGLFDYELTVTLLNRGADPNARNRLGHTPLMSLAQMGLASGEEFHLKIAQLLVSRGADIGLRDNEGMTAAEIAGSRGNPLMAALLSDMAKKPQGSSP